MDIRGSMGTQVVEKLLMKSITMLQAAALQPSEERLLIGASECFVGGI